MKTDGTVKNIQQKHEVSGFFMLRVSTEPALNKCEPVLYSGDNVMEEFYRQLKKEREEIDFYLRTNLPMEPLTPDEQKTYNEAKNCQQCDKPFDDTVAMRKVRHHRHLTGKYEKAVCNSCNLQLKPRIKKMFRKKYIFEDEEDNEGSKVKDQKEKGRAKSRGRGRGRRRGHSGKSVQPRKRARSMSDDDTDDDDDDDEFNFDEMSTARTKGNFFIPVIANNMRGYDSHIILKDLTKQFPEEMIQVIANNQEKYISFNIGSLRFIDSLQFLGCGLETLVTNLKRSSTQEFELTRTVLWK